MESVQSLLSLQKYVFLFLALKTSPVFHARGQYEIYSRINNFSTVVDWHRLQLKGIEIKVLVLPAA